MWVLDDDKEKAQKSIMESAEELLKLSSSIELSYDFPSSAESNDVLVCLKLNDCTLAVGQTMKNILTDAISKSDNFVIRKTDDGCIELIFAVYGVETWNPNLHATAEDLKELGLAD